MRTLIENGLIVTMNEQDEVFEHGYVYVCGDQIVEVGTGYCEREVDCRIDAKGGIVMPGMINTHCHVPMIPFRSMGDDCPDRLRRFLFPLEIKAMTPQLVYAAACYGIAELLLSGVTTFLDMYYFEEEVAKACEVMGIRGYLGETVINMETCDSKDPCGGLSYGETFIKRWKGHPLVYPIIAPHATNTCEPEQLKQAFALAEKYDTLFTLHVSEMDYELSHFRDVYQMTPTEFLHDLGLLSSRTIAAHCIHMTENDLKLLSKTNTKVAHCIGSNTKAGKGVCPVKDMVEHGVSVGLGTDGPSSGNTLSLLTQFRLFASFQKTYYKDRSLFLAKEIVRLGTIEGARVLNAEAEIGSLEIGKKADIVIFEQDSVNMFPCYNPYSVLVYSAEASNIATVMVNGRVVVQDRKLVSMNVVDLRKQLEVEMAEFRQLAFEYKELL